MCFRFPPNSLANKYTKCINQKSEYKKKTKKKIQEKTNKIPHNK